MSRVLLRPISLPDAFAVVGAMFYVSPQLTAVMLAVVPPISLGAVREDSFLVSQSMLMKFSSSFMEDISSASQTRRRRYVTSLFVCLRGHV